MLRKILGLACLLAVLLAGCGTPMSDHEAFKPKLTENGGPKELYSIRADQLPGLFVLGTPEVQIQQRFGKPAFSGKGVDKAGRPTSWATYSYSRNYIVVDTDFNTLHVFRATSATLTYDEESALRELSFSRIQRFANSVGKVDRDASDEEVARFLGAPQALDIRPPATAAAKPAASPPSAAAPTGWKLGTEISELRTELAKQSGYKGRGVYVVTVDPNGLAARAGLAKGDVIVKLNGGETPTRDDLVDQLKSIPQTSALTLQVFTRGSLRNLTIPAQQGGAGTMAI